MMALFVEFAMQRDLPTEAAGDAPDFHIRHQSSARPKFRLPFP